MTSETNAYGKLPYGFFFNKSFNPGIGHMYSMYSSDDKCLVQQVPIYAENSWLFFFFFLQQVSLFFPYEYTNKDREIQSINQIRVLALFYLETALHIS